MNAQLFTEADVVFAYTAKQAIEEGVLVHPYPKRFPGLLFTAGVHAAIEEQDDGRTYDQKAIPLIMDAVMIAKAKPNDHMWTKGLEGNVTGQTVWIAENEFGSLTLMFLEEY